MCYSCIYLTLSKSYLRQVKIDVNDPIFMLKFLLKLLLLLNDSILYLWFPDGIHVKSVYYFKSLLSLVFGYRNLMMTKRRILNRFLENTHKTKSCIILVYKWQWFKMFNWNLTSNVWYLNLVEKSFESFDFAQRHHFILFDLICVWDLSITINQRVLFKELIKFVCVRCVL